MASLNDHPVLWQCYDVIQRIEECGASVPLTKAVVAAGELLNELMRLVDSGELVNKNPIPKTKSAALEEKSPKKD